VMNGSWVREEGDRKEVRDEMVALLPLQCTLPTQRRISISLFLARSIVLPNSFVTRHQGNGGQGLSSRSRVVAQPQH
jgi:hypothetical protein